MYLKKLEISGFKSFLNRLEMEFSDGITAILGPNGCGKTNIVDAIRWVLGEQKTRLLRNTKMENVIFNGTKLRKPLGMAEVHMTLANDDRTLPVEYDEIRISRKLYRSGLSEYYLNGELSRLKDIKGLLVDSGLGSHTYSIIEREMVDSVIREKDQDKRFLLEEAAGVMRYRIQREEALRKIKQTEVDLTRLGDILAELEKELRSLRYQMGKARRYARLKEKVDRMDAALVKRSLLELLERSDAVRQDKARHEGVTLAGENEITIREDRLQAARIRGAEFERRLQDLHESRYELSRSLQQREEKIAILTERIGAARSRIVEDGEEIERAAAKIRSLAEDLERYRRTAEEKEAGYARRKADLEEKETLHARLAEELATLRRRLEDKKRLALALVREEERERGLRELLESRLEELEDREEREVADERSLQERETALSERVSGGAAAVGEKRERIAELALAIEESSRKSQRLVELVARCDDSYSAASIELHGLRQKKEYLQRIKNEHTRELLDDDPRVKGVLAEHVSVDKKYRKCFEACLSPVLQGLVAESREDAFDCLRQITRRGAGTVQLLYPDGKGARPPEASGDGVIGPALDFVRGERGVMGYLEPYLADVVLVRDVDAAIGLLGKSGRARVATLDGVFFDGRGRIIVAGTEDIDTTLLEFETKINEIVSAVGRLDRRTAHLRRRKERLTHRKNELLGEAARQKAELRAEEARKERLVEEQRKHEIEVATVREKLAAVKASIGESQRAIDEIRSRLASRPAPTAAPDQPADEDLAALERRAGELEREKESVGREAAKIQLEVVSIAGEIATGKEKLGNAEMLDGELRELIRSREEDAERCRAEIAAAEAEIESSREEIADHHRRVDAVEKEIDEARESYGSVKAQCDELEKELKELKSQRDEKKDNLQRCSLELATIDTRIGGLLEKARENFNQDLEPYTKDRSLFDASEWEDLDHDGLAALRTQLETFGPVNMLAVEEFNEKKERFDFLSGQKADLDEAKESLIQAIRRINREARQRLSETFEIVRENFKRTFLTLFDGGEADLLFVDSDDPLEANIKIVASPKGKRLHDISSLSGGERALVALSLLFAIYLVKPSPFCVFDEVDAPLDDANIARFVNMLRTFTDRTQFIVITHNKKTMEAANHLYGVTMQEPGVSKMISVHIGQVDKFRDTAAPERRITDDVRDEEVPVET